MTLAEIQAGGGGALGVLARVGLRILSFGWGAAQVAKNVAYRIGLRRARQVDRPVVSVGNLVAGGTGKTPFVIALAQALRDLGSAPGILARGYRREPGEALNDEGREILEALGDGVPQVQDPDRVRGGRRLIAAHPGVDVVLLDDGFQHRRLHRDVDIVLLDATQPFGHGYLLPRGLLRESPRALSRAHLVVLTRCEQVEASALDALTARVQALNAQAPVFRVHTQPTTVRFADRTERPAALAGRRVHAAAGLGNPTALHRSLEGLGADVVAFTPLRDHETPTADRWRALARAARDDGAVLVITRKDAVKLDALLPGMAVLEIRAVLDPEIARTVRDYSRSSSVASTSGSVRS